MCDQPQLSIVLPILDSYVGFRRTVHHLQAQTLHDQLELVLVATPDSAATVVTDDMTGFCGHQVIVLDTLETAAEGFAAGVRAARSPLVTMAEDHAYPDPTWAEIIIAAHQHDYCAVGPAMKNANPNTAVSWANFLLCFVEWFDPSQSQVVESLPAHNTVYKRDALLRFGDHLLEMLQSERMLHYRLLKENGQLYLEQQAHMAHVNISRLPSYLSHSFNGGRIFGALRAADWSLPRRGVYTVLAPLVPLIRLRRLHATLRRTRENHDRMLWRTLPLVILGLCAHAAGEAVGYTLGSGRAPATYMHFELRRQEHVSLADKKLFEL